MGFPRTEGCLHNLPFTRNIMKKKYTRDAIFIITIALFSNIQIWWFKEMFPSLMST